MNVLITGSSGFVGGFIVEYALQQDWNVYAAVRKSSNRQYLTDPRIKFVELNLSDKDAIRSTLEAFYEQHGNLDFVIHNAGVTKTTNKRAYYDINFGSTVQLIQSLEQSQHTLKKFTFISSMAAGPGSTSQIKPVSLKNGNYEDPVSNYGWSKKKAETFIEESCKLPYIILRPPAVFGPRDRDMLPVFEMVNKHLEVYIGYKMQHLSLIYVKDLARGIVTATLSKFDNKKYQISDRGYYDNAILQQTIKSELGKRTFKVKLPLFLVYIVAFFSQLVSKVTGNVSKLSLDVVNELKCLNWLCDSEDFYRDMQIEPNYSLEQAIRETADWYKEKKWLK